MQDGAWKSFYRIPILFISFFSFPSDVRDEIPQSLWWGNLDSSQWFWLIKMNFIDEFIDACTPIKKGQIILFNTHWTHVQFVT